MVKKHLKRYFVPKTWPIKKKELVYVTRQNPGPHSNKISAPLNIILRDLLHYSHTTKESKHILNRKNVLVDGVRRKEPKFPVGLFDVIEFKDIDKSYRVVLDDKNKLDLIEVDKNESNIKPCKIINKTAVKGKIQINLNDGKNILLGKNEYKTGDTLVLDLPKLTVKNHISLKKNVLIYLTGGKHMGEIGKIKDIIGNRIMYARDNGDAVETLKEYAFAIGETKPIIKVGK
jgi:small subunit ribosomal protein S4e|tara:strand:+ start:255 stop:947 length:693 start_codon:yes stop_codon:yes gene_type:complete